MRKNFGAKPMLYPQPVFIISTYNDDGTPNAMNAAWGGISEESEITVCIDSGHKTAKNLLVRGAFCISMADARHIEACDYVGVVSGNDVPDKFARAGFTAQRSELVDAPIISELPMTLECRVKSYDTDTCRLVGEIVNVSADESVLDEKGRVDADKLMPITYDPSDHSYRIVGKRVGNAFKDGLSLK